MRKEIRFAGFGGQGIISMAIVLAHAAGQFEGLEVAQTQSYGPEARGGACRAEVVVDSEEIDYIKAIAPDVFVAMSQPALDKFGASLTKEALLIVDSALVDRIPEDAPRVLSVDATGVAERELGGRLFANIYMLGVLIGSSRIVSPDSVREALKAIMPPRHVEKNIAAFDAGLAYTDGTRP
jgi:2-oxoglutarate ferredoxin oxidoreductase subunit gamma